MSGPTSGRTIPTLRAMRQSPRDLTIFRTQHLIQVHRLTKALQRLQAGIAIGEEAADQTVGLGRDDGGLGLGGALQTGRQIRRLVDGCVKWKWHRGSRRRGSTPVPVVQQ